MFPSFYFQNIFQKVFDNIFKIIIISGVRVKKTHKGDLQMIGSITLVRGKVGTQIFFTFGYYDSEHDLFQAVEELQDSFKRMGRGFETNYYIRKDGYIAYYITLAD